MHPDLPRLRDELATLISSWEYAFAMGHGCSIGDHPDLRAIRRLEADLRARIAELTA
jgi:hypothetical protein